MYDGLNGKHLSGSSSNFGMISLPLSRLTTTGAQRKRGTSIEESALEC